MTQMRCAQFAPRAAPRARPLPTRCACSDRAALWRREPCSGHHADASLEGAALNPAYLRTVTRTLKLPATSCDKNTMGGLVYRSSSSALQPGRSCVPAVVVRDDPHGD